MSRGLAKRDYFWPIIAGLSWLMMLGAVGLAVHAAHLARACQ